ncbi:MAG TPA: BolA family protein [Candidatus Margulisiibacteriota bacterium]|nr:BolA family protein [Candidatus Margulisiibacteriota bacterium]
MSLNVVNPTVDLCAALRGAIENALPGAQVEVAAGSPGHFQIRVISERFAGKSMVQQQQLVYAAIAHLMKGADAPVHAIDRMQTLAPSSMPK